MKYINRLTAPLTAALLLVLGSGTTAASAGSHDQQVFANRYCDMGLCLPGGTTECMQWQVLEDEEWVTKCMLI